ncbi:hypothetical protein VTN49DRAFT_1698 [Thermomyces lanuginosus]|uniref:uncharacterized protein n=1 Tax=Thermomyces lanuginosus TaxID=5541 RepID=UPI003743DE9A
MADSNVHGPTAGLSIPRPPSPGGISSRMTDIVSEDGNQTVTQSVTQSQRRGSTQYRPSSRRGQPGISFGATAARPGSSSSRMSRVTQTHVPSLTHQAFFRPMSSQRLQAHRGPRPPTQGPAPSSPPADEPEDDRTRHRHSLLSNSTVRAGLQAMDLEVPPSRGTDFTDPIIPDRNTSNASPTGNTTTARSLGESVQLLHEREKKPMPGSRLSIKSYAPSNHLRDDPPQKSPMSFRSGLLTLQNKNEEVEDEQDRSHQRLSSTGSSAARSMKPEPQQPTEDLGRNYEYFTGNNVFFGKGRFLNSRDKPINIATGLLVILPAGLFFGYSAPWLWHNVSPAIPIIFAYLFFICFSSFIHASTVDPGIFPRNLHPMPPTDPSADPLALGPPTSDWVMVKLATSDVAAMDVPVKYCKTCNIWRPPRCYHCRVCDNCIETLDHHCVWLNNCVGRRNYRYFFTFVSTTTILALYLMAVSLAHIIIYQNRNGITFGQSIDRWRAPFAMVIYGALAFPYPATLWAYHLFLMGRGETTREHLNSRKFKKADRHRPFTQGNILRNWIVVLCRPRPPTYMQFKKPYQQGDQRFATQKRKFLANKDLEAQAGLEMQPVSPATQENPSS